MKKLSKILFATMLGGFAAFGVSSVFAAPVAPAAAAAEKAKNWTPPAHKIKAQVLSDQIMAAHPELLSITFHGVPPGMTDVYTMFAGSFPERIGNPDDPDDVMVIQLGITIIDPRWHRTKDTVAKFVMMMPLRDAAGENIGLLVAAYKNPAGSGKGEKYFFEAGTKLRDSVQKKIPSYASLFDEAN